MGIGNLLIAILWGLGFLYFSMMCLGAAINWNHGLPLRGIPRNGSHLIIQITTIGNSTVNEIIQRVKGYHLPIPMVFWVVNEPSDSVSYPGADLVLTVPQSFRSKARCKARAMEYARKYRMAGVRDGRLTDYLMLFLDDDSIPSKEFIEDCWRGEFDILEGMISPTNNYGTLISYLDRIRTNACLTNCALFQGISKPVWVHGEAMCISQAVDAQVSWDYPLFASEDLVYGQTAVKLGFRMRHTYSRVNITSPLSVKDFVTQRRRWLWGNIHAISAILPFAVGAKVLFFWIFNGLVFVGSMSVVLLETLGLVQLTPSVLLLGQVSLAAWLIVWAVTGYLVRPSKKSNLATTVLAYASVIFLHVVLTVSLMKGPIHNFDVIEKRV